MNSTPITVDAANEKLQTDLILNGIGTQALHETVVAYRANRRAGTHSTKTKAEVNRSGKKPWRQKGTGNARAGYASSPIWRGGGVVFGPKPRDYSKNTNVKVKKLALKKAISSRVIGGDIFIEPSFNVESGKTKDFVSALSPVLTADNTVLLVLEGLNQQVLQAARNHPRVAVTTADFLNAEDLLRPDRIIIVEGALAKISNRLKA
ncbi:MAG: 50S ribosomal protein L4 [Candidatus Methylacidiphilales bacterium]|nr:50S ribosomal protein L4 [Candidatus Methylacidiphilales bacterium]